VPEKCPETLNDAIALLRQRDRELERVGLQLTQAREELEETNRGLIALYSELQEARKAEARFATVVQSSSDAVISLLWTARSKPGIPVRLTSSVTVKATWSEGNCAW